MQRNDMSQATSSPAPGETTPAAPHAAEAGVTALRLIAAILLLGASSLMAPIVVPLALALVLAVALSPLADRLESLGLPRLVASLLCVLALAAALVAVCVVIAGQVGQILQHADQYLERFSAMLAHVSRATGGDRMLRAIGSMRADPAGSSAGSSEAAGYWYQLLSGNARALGHWVAVGLGGLLGFVGGAVVCLGTLFYMLLTRSEWVERLMATFERLGMKPRRRALEHIRAELTVYLRTLLLVSLSYGVLITLALWAIGVPNPLLWGVLTAILEVIPYFGPVIAGALPTLVSLGTGGPLWQPIAVVALFCIVQGVEGNVVAPILYGKAVDFDPVIVIVGVLFFGFLWGPVGLSLALPVMILLRGLLTITPDTPALDALMETSNHAGDRDAP
jgi:predicted PurR-regulated permease PerM